MRLVIVLLAVLWASPAASIVIDCPDGSRCAVDDPAKCKCVDICDDGSWVIEGQACHPSTPSDSAAASPRAASTAQQDPGIFEALMGTLFIGLIATPVVALYFAPTIVASRRKHPKRSGIGALNTLLGWTLLGWIGSMVWAYSGGVSRGQRLCAACRSAIDARARVCPQCRSAVA